MYQLLSSTTIVCLISCGILNVIGWTFVRRDNVVRKNMRRLGFRRFLLPLAEQSAASSSPNLVILAQVQHGMVCAYIVLIILSWGVFHANAGYYYLQLAYYLMDIFPGVTWA